MCPLLNLNVNNGRIWFAFGEVLSRLPNHSLAIVTNHHLTAITYKSPLTWRAWTLHRGECGESWHITRVRRKKERYTNTVHTCTVMILAAEFMSNGAANGSTHIEKSMILNNQPETRNHKNTRVCKNQIDHSLSIIIYRQHHSILLVPMLLYCYPFDHSLLI